MDFFNNNILSIITFWPLVGMLVLLLIPKESTALIKWWANLVAVSGFFVSLPLWLSFNFDDPNMQKVVNVPWIQSLGANYHVGVDGISLLLVMLTTLIGPLAVLSSWDGIQIRVKEYHAFRFLL